MSFYNSFQITYEYNLLWPPLPGAWSISLGHLHHHVLFSPEMTWATGHQGPCQVHLEQHGVCKAAEVHSWGAVKVNYKSRRRGLEGPPQPFPPSQGTPILESAQGNVCPGRPFHLCHCPDCSYLFSPSPLTCTTGFALFNCVLDPLV